jgi:hypothetical protein
MSLTAVPGIDRGERISVEEMQEEKTLVQLKGGTREDEREMSRMGKTQELRVRSAPSGYACPAD